MKKQITKKTVFLTFFIFLAVWCIRAAALKPAIDASLAEWPKEIVNGLIKSLIWVILPVYWIKKYKPPISLKEMFTTRIKWSIFLPVLAVFVAYCVIGMFATPGGLGIRADFHPSKLIGQFLLVGILEELAFRGWFLNGLSSTMSPWKANAVQAVLFMLIHYPSYIVDGTFTLSTYLVQSVFLLVMGLVFGWTFQKSRSLWVPIILHSVYDLMVITIVGAS